MIKKLTFIMIILVCIFSSCRQEEIGLPGEEPTKDSAKENSLYLNINLALSDDCGTRSYGKNDYDADWDESQNSQGDYDYSENGLEYEREFINGKVFVYSVSKGGDEDEAILVTSGDILSSETIDTKNVTSITSHHVRCKNIKLDLFELDESGETDYYVLVVLNENMESPNQFIEPTLGQKFSVWANTPQTGSMTILNGKYTDPNYPKYKDYFDRYYLTMTNATGHVSKGSSDNFNPTTLIKIKPGDISKSEISNDPSTIVYVQRVVAKVTLIPSAILAGYNKRVVVGEWDVQTSIAKWGLDVINTKTYPVMKIKDNNFALLWDKSHSHSGAGEYDRVFWGIDPNYHSDTPLSANNFKRLSSFPGWYDVKIPEYCLENTFDECCMLQGQTTRIIARCRWQWDIPDATPKLKEGCNFKQNYTYFDDNNQEINATYEAFYRVGLKNIIWCRPHIEDALKTRSKDIFNEINKENNLEFSEDNFEIKWDNTIQAGGFYPLNDLLSIYCKTEVNDIPGENNDEDIYYSEEKDKKFKFEKIKEESLNKIATALELEDATQDLISLYLNSHMYFVIRIPHFLNISWDEYSDVTRKENGTKIAKYKPEHLGRYGIVRNNSYEVYVDEIKNMGYPCIPPITDDDTDDMPRELYLSVRIKVLSWAEHNINVSF